MKNTLKVFTGMVLCGSSLLVYAQTARTLPSYSLAATVKKWGDIKTAAAMQAQPSQTQSFKKYKKPPKFIKPLVVDPLYTYSPVDELVCFNETRIKNLLYGTYMLENIRGSDQAGNLCRKYPTQDRLFVGNMFDRTMFTLCDGHGTYGDKIADRVIKGISVQVLNSKDVATGYSAACKTMQEQLFKNSYAYRSGSTFVSGIIKDALLTVANVGDSRLIVVRPSKPTVLFSTQDHKATQYTGLAISRALGDVEIYNRGHITSVPDISTVKLQQDDYIVIASDGYWDVVTNDETYSLVTKAHEKKVSSKEMAQSLAQLARKRTSRDDISVMVIHYNDNDTLYQAAH